MSSEESAQWELSKENIQPLKQGRKVAALSVAFDENEAKSLALARQEFETEIRTYSGDDPLDIWHRYALWTEQSFPKGGKGSKLYKLIESCVSAFQMDGHSLEKYANDPRFLDLWVKYASMCPKPLEVYQTMEAKGLCTELALFYENWAWEYERMRNFKKADAVYIRGLQQGAKPSDVLQLAHKNFQVRVARMAIEVNQTEDNIEDNEPQRGVFNTLKGVGLKKKAPHERAGPGAVLGSAGKLRVQDTSNKIAPSFQIYSDENATPSIRTSCTPSAKSGSLPINLRNDRENEKEAAKWTKQKLSQRTTSVVAVEDVDKYNKPAFEVHQDENCGWATPKPSSTNDVLTARSKQSDMWHVPMFVSEPFDPKKQPQYPRHKVYCGTEEFSLEELRAANHFKKVKEREFLMADVKATVMGEFMEMKKELEKHKEMISKLVSQGNHKQGNHKERYTSQQDVSRQLYHDSWIAVNKSVNVSVNSSQMFEDMKPSNPSAAPVVQVFEDMNSNSSDKVAVTSALHSKSNSESGCLLSANSTQNAEASPTVNTKQAMSMIKDFWNGSLFNTTTNTSSATDELLKQRDGGSFVFKDTSKETQPEAVGGSCGFIVYEDQPIDPQQKPQPQLPFSIHSDQSKTIASQAPFPIYTDEKTANDGSSDPNDQYLDDRDENQPPPGYVVQPKRTLSGILQPSKDIEVIPLEEQKKLEEEIHEEDEVLAEPLAKPLEEEKTLYGAKAEDQSMFGYNHPDMTLKVPGSSEAFARNARVASTPAPWSIDVVPQAETYGDDFTLAILSGKRSHCFMSEQDLVGDVKKEKLKNSPEKEEEELSGELMPPPHSEVPEKPLSPIMECSREYRSSSSSSGSSTLGGHWTSHQRTTGGQSLFHMSRSRHLSSIQSEFQGESRYETTNETSGAMPTGELSKSGYMADKSCGESLAKGRHPFVPQLKPVEDNTFDPGMMASVLMGADDMMVDLNDYEEPTESKDESQEPTQAVASSKETQKVTLPLADKVDPFDEELRNHFLDHLQEPVNQRGGYLQLRASLPVVKSDIQLSLGPEVFQVKRKCGEGAYAQVFLAVTLDPMNVTVLPMDVEQTDEEDDIMQVVLKVEKPSCHWEFYICHELRQRLKAQRRPEHILDAVLRMNRGYFFSNGSIMVNPYHKYGSLLNVINVYRKTGSSMPEDLVLYFTIEMLAILEAVHSCNIIHADIKPDNFILASRPEIKIPASSPEEMFSKCPQSLKLIDFGRSIDMTLFPKGTTFTKKVTTETFTCCEMQDGRPWTYQTDLYCVAATAHCMLRGNYMTVVRDEDKKIWKLKDGVFKRYWLKQLWAEFFHTILNVESCSDIPSAGDLKRKFIKGFFDGKKHKEFRMIVGSLFTNLNDDRKV